jgi:hypothetical protein
MVTESGSFCMGVSLLYFSPCGCHLNLTVHRQYETLFPVLVSGLAADSTSSKTRRDLARELYEYCTRPAHSPIQPFCSLHATWLSILQAAITSTQGVDPPNTDYWIGALSSAMLSNQIECTPGVYKSRISHRRIIRLVGQSPPPAALQARPGSLKRAAIEAHLQSQNPPKKARIKFNCPIPFRRIPPLIEQGFKHQEQYLKGSNDQILGHYQLARHCLEACLGDPMCDLMLMLALTLASSSETPTIKPQSRLFTVGPHKDPAMLASTLVTRMLWYLRPESFPWTENRGAVLSIPEMTKKIGIYIDSPGPLIPSVLIQLVSFQNTKVSTIDF